MACIFMGAKEVAGVKMTFLPGFLDTLNQLPVVEPWTETAGDWLRVLGAVVMAEVVVS